MGLDSISFMKAVRPFKVKVLAGILVLRNAKMAEFMNAYIPGVSVPQEIIDERRARERIAPEDQEASSVFHNVTAGPPIGRAIA